jgi:ERCC4-type nuclease
MPEPRLTILLDTRERSPAELRIYTEAVEARGWRLEREGLPVGDIGIKGFSDWNRPFFSIERKTPDDLVKSLTKDRERFFRMLQKLRIFRTKILMIESTRAAVEMKQYVSNTHPNSILGSLDAIQVRMGIAIEWVEDLQTGAERACDWAKQFANGIEKEAEILRRQTLDD